LYRHGELRYELGQFGCLKENVFLFSVSHSGSFYGAKAGLLSSSASSYLPVSAFLG